MGNIQETAEALKQVVEQHSVCYEVWPEYRLVGEKQTMVGFSLELYGTHDHGYSTLTPGCERCRATYRDLRRIADRILPQERRPSRYEISRFDRGLHESAKRRFRPEVVLAIGILHREHGFDPVDACEERCLKEMEEKLRGLGARRGN